ncbi:MAG: tyrosine-type recombinase/integrase [Janthinobacterium lividum]
MASYTKRDNTWRVQIARKGVRLNASFPTKAQAVAWATQKGAEILAGTIKIAGDKTVAEIFRHHATIVSPEKRGARWEYLRIEAFCRVFPALANKRLSEVGAPEFATWRDARLKQVSDGTVIREMNLFSNIFSIARDEWKWIGASPPSGVRRPKSKKPRDRRITADEEERLLFALGYADDEQPRTIQARIGAAFLFAIETGMRAGETVGLTWDRVFPYSMLALLPEYHSMHGAVCSGERASKRIIFLQPRCG